MLDIPTTTPPVANAIPILVHPFPVPNVCITYGKRPERNNNASSPLGISFRSIEGTHHTPGLVVIHHISDTIRRQQQQQQGTTGHQVREGQVVISIDGIAVTSPQHAESLIRASNDENENESSSSSYYTIITREIVMAPFCRFVVRHCTDAHSNPGIAFAPTRDHTLVQISRIFKNGPFYETSLKKGDIVLAVNQYAVTTPDQALRALQISKYSTFTSIYVIDIRQFRCSILREVKMSDAKKFGLVRIEASDGLIESATFKVTNTTIATLEFNPNTQHIIDRQQFKNRFTCKDISKFCNYL